MPNVPCWLVDLQFPPPGPGDPAPDLVRLWIEQSLTKALDHRIEQYRGSDLIRVVVSEGWAQPGPGRPWGAAKRTFIDAQSGRSTTLTVQSLDLQLLVPSTFNVGNLTSGTW